MIRIGILDLSGCSERELVSASQRLEKTLDIEKKNNQKANAQSIFARLLLTKVYKTFKNEALPEIKNAEKGKPYFLYGGGRVKNEDDGKLGESDDNGRIYFNISHDKNIVAVAVSDAQELGIDIQSKKEKMRSRQRIEKTLRTFLDDAHFSWACEISEDIELLFYKLDTDKEGLFAAVTPEGRVLHSLVGDLSESDARFLYSWTRLESLLKLSGGGFADLSKVRGTALSARVESLFIKDEKGEIYSLSLSHHRNSSISH